MTSLALDYQDRIQKDERIKKMKEALAKKDQEKIETESAETESFNLLVDSLESDCKRVSALPMGTERNNLKKNELIPTYSPYVDSYLSKGEVYKNPVLVQVMIWCFDIGDIDKALTLADVCIDQKQSLPERFKRSMVAFVADEVKKWAEAAQEMKGSIEPYFSSIFAKLEEWPLHDPVKVDYYKIAAREAQLQDDLKKALELYKKAQKLDPVRAKVKTIIEKLEKKVNKNC